MAFDFEVISGEGGRGSGRRWRYRWREWIPQAVCLVVSVAVLVGLAVTNAEVDPGNLWAIPTVPLWITVFTGHVWRRSRVTPDGLDSSLLRRQMRRMVWRAALVLVFVAFGLLWVASFWHWRASIADDAGNYSAVGTDAGHYSFFAGLWWWPLPVAAFLVVVQPIFFQLARSHYAKQQW